MAKKKIKKTRKPKMVRSIFEEETFEYGGGGNADRFDWFKNNISGLKTKEAAEKKANELKKDTDHIRSIKVFSVDYSWGKDWRDEYEYLARRTIGL